MHRKPKDYSWEGGGVFDTSAAEGGLLPNYINFGLRPDSNMAAVEDEVDDHFNDIDIESLLSRAQRRPLTFNRKKSVYIGKSCTFHSAISRVCVSWHVCLLLHGAKLSLSLIHI